MMSATRVGSVGSDQRDSYKALFYPESTFGDITDIDGTVAFYTRVNALIQSAFVVLDFGCGRGSRQDDTVAFRRVLCTLKGRVSKVIGIDVDPIGQENPYLDEFRPLLPGSAWPVEDGATDLIVCDSVMEHLPDPPSFFQEARRVLADGGYLCIRTPNVHSYLGVASRLVPNRYHSKVLSKVQTGRKNEDVFPTLYRCNTISRLRRSLRNCNFRAVVYGYEAEPGYLNFSKLAYATGVVHQKFAPGFLRPTIFAFGQSQPAGRHAGDL